MITMRPAFSKTDWRGIARVIDMTHGLKMHGQIPDCGYDWNFVESKSSLIIIMLEIIGYRESSWPVHGVELNSTLQT